MKVAIIGGSGKMGKWFASFLTNDGKEVTITGRDQSRLRDVQRQLGVKVSSNTGAARNADFILVSVPPDSFESVIKEISPAIHDGQTVVDITSTKVYPVEIMHKYIKKGLVLGTHPLFGPGAKSLSGQSFILTPTSEPEKERARKMQSYLENRGAKVTQMAPQEHDELMSIVLSLSHFIGIVTADTLLASDRLEQLRAVGGITFKVLMTLAQSVVSEDPELYASLQMNLPDTVRFEGLFLERAEYWAALVKNKDKQAFIEGMNSLRSRLEKSPGFARAYRDMYKISEALNTPD